MVKSGSMRLASAVDRKVKYQYLYSSGAVVRADSMSAVVMGSVAVNPGADGRPSATHTHSYYNSQAVCKQTTKIEILFPSTSKLFRFTTCIYLGTVLYCTLHKTSAKTSLSVPRVLSG